MTILQEKMRVVSQRLLARDIYELVLSGALAAQIAAAGQFVNVAVPSAAMILRRPISISSWEATRQELTLIYRAGGAETGTRALSRLVEGATVDVLGPLGRGYDLSQLTEGSRALIVGGGIGTPPLVALAQKLSRRGCDVTVLLGFASTDQVILEEAFAKLPRVSVEVATDDGSYGLHGHVGRLMEALSVEPDAVFACGPAVMLRAVAARYTGVVGNVQLSLEARMACGIGACYACVVHRPDDPTRSLRVCKDGPVFQAGEVVI